VLESALRIASVQGLDGVTFGQVADAVKISKGHLAQQFGDREALQLATLDAALGVFTSHVGERAEAAPTAHEKLRRYCLGWFDYVENRILPGGCLITAASSEFRTIAGPVRDRVIAFRERRREYLSAAIKTVVEESGGRPRKGEVDDLVNQIFAYQAGANVASLLEDEGAFLHAKRATAALIDSLGKR
jgi:AcrR family transcriptional regulator